MLELDHGIIKVPGQPGQVALLDLRFLLRISAFNNEVGVIFLDSSGRVNGLAPGAPGFLQQAFLAANHRVLFPKGRFPIIKRKLQVPAGAQLLFYLVQNNTTNTLRLSNPGNLLSLSPLAFFAKPKMNPDHFAHVRFRSLRSGGFLLFWEDATHGGDQDFNDVIMTVRLVSLG
jgi:hypothetical protein